MAQFNAKGIEGLVLSFEQFQNIPDDVVEEMLDAKAEVVVAAHKRSLDSLGLIDTHTLKQSIKAHKKSGGKKNDFKRYVLIYPTGTHHTYQSRERTKIYANSKSGRTYTYGGEKKNASNNEVGFVHEFGAPHQGIKASQWMRRANDKSEDAANAAALVVYNNWLKSNNL